MFEYLRRQLPSTVQKITAMSTSSRKTYVYIGYGRRPWKLLDTRGKFGAKIKTTSRRGIDLVNTPKGELLYLTTNEK